jgi:aspartyl-tRNA(Asn)/glutamyl-tRNA(Gln) amidotransferase subunit C
MTNQIGKELIEKVAKLSNLKLKEEEIELFSNQFKDILSFIDKLNEVDVKDTLPFYELQIEEKSEREDVPTDSITNEEALKNAPQAEGGFFVVPRVVGEE